MKYQFVIQWSANSIKDFDAMTVAEDALIAQLTDEHEVDGHDAGSGETNIFVLTNDFGAAFIETKAILDAEGLWEGVQIAYRDVAKSEYTVLWPNDLKEFSVA